MLECLEAVLARHGAAGARVASIVDLCCGKGFLSLVLACEFPDAHVLGLDFDARIDTGHAAAAPNLAFVRRDLFADELEAELDAVLAAHGAGVEGALCVAVGMHLCGRLSPRAVRLFGVLGALDLIILAPCCLDAKFDGALKLRARQLQVDPYECKVAQLTELLRELGAHVETVRDAALRTKSGTSSEGSACSKNALVIGWRALGADAARVRAPWDAVAGAAADGSLEAAAVVPTAATAAVHPASSGDDDDHEHDESQQQPSPSRRPMPTLEELALHLPRLPATTHHHL